MIETRDQFEEWLFAIDDNLDKLRDILPIGGQLDFREESLDVLECWLLESYDSIEKLQRDFIKWELTSIYIGELFRKKLNVKWNIRLEDSNYVFYQVPEIALPTPVCPFFLATACIDRQKGNFLSTVFRNNLKRYG